MSKLTTSTFNRLFKTTRSCIAGLAKSFKDLSPSEPFYSAKVNIIEGSLREEYQKFKSWIDSYLSDPKLPEDLTDEIIQEAILEVQNDYQLLLFELTPGTNKVSAGPASNPSPGAEPAIADLPRLSISKFSGHVKDWPAFIACFNSLVTSRASLTDLKKFQYLLGALEKPAHDIVSRLPLLDASFQKAIDLLTKRYHNPRQAVAYHCDEILSLPKFDARNAVSMRAFLDKLNVQYESLSTIPNSNVYEMFMVSFLMTKLDTATRNSLETQHAEPTSLPSYPELVEFLLNQVVKRENMSLLSSSPANNTYTHRPSISLPQPAPRWSALTAAATPNKPSCPLCHSSSHNLYGCETFAKQSPLERQATVREFKRCFNCLGSHARAQCKSHSKCRVCHKAHHTLLHSTDDPPVVKDSRTSDGRKVAISSTPVSPTHVPTPSCNISQEAFSPMQSSTVLLSTCIVKLQTSDENYIVVRAVLDTASHVSLMTERCAQWLKVTRSKTPITVSGVGQTLAPSAGLCHIDLATLAGQTVASQHPFLIISQITSNLPTMPISSAVCTSSKNYVLADPTFHLPGAIDCLIGADITPAVITGSPISLGDSLPYIINTLFGYVLMGQAPTLGPVCNLSTSVNLSPLPTDHVNQTALHQERCAHSPVVLSSLVQDSSDDLLNAIQAFWRVEEPPAHNYQDETEVYCEQLYQSTTTFSNGRYTVRLPFKTDHPPLGDSYQKALVRLRALERKFASNPTFKSKYMEFMRDYESQAHMLPTDAKFPKYFIPHHGIFKSHGDVEKLRVVFDASVSTASGPSLNDILYAGPKLQTMISDVITLFRRYKHVFVADICQMFRQIMIHPEDQAYQCILWREEPSQPIRIYKLTTVTYGLTSAPYLALRTLQQLSADHQVHYPLAAKVLKETTFVDDIVAGADDILSALSIRNELTSLLACGGFQLKKWAANHPDLLAGIPLEDIQSPSTDPSSRSISMLGLDWYPHLDYFQFATLPSANDTGLTKRKVLSEIAKFYDPCGWLAPVTMKAKCFMQRLWLSPLQWDTPLSPRLTEEYREFSQEISALCDIKIARPLIVSDATLQLHGFSDASKHGYAAVIYLHSPLAPPYTVLLTSKTRVAPIKTLSLPRLELLGAHLLAQLTFHYTRLLKNHLNITESYLWCDSTIVLGWLKIPPNQLKTFVANRVSQILEWTHIQDWRYVPSEENAADVASRGINPSMLQHHPMWWDGPPWLTQDPVSWPATPSSAPLLPSSEFAPPATLITSTLNAEDLFPSISSWPRLIRVITIILGWRHKSIRKQPPLSTSSLYRQAFDVVCKYIQKSYFADVYQCLKRKQRLPKPLHKLFLFIDHNDVIRVRGRFAAPIDSSYPILLPKSHRLVSALIDYYHRLYAHAGSTLLQAQLQRRVWIISMRQVIRSRICKCVQCFRVRPTNEPPLMGDLPTARLTPTPPFQVSGMDFAGPFTARLHHLRKSTTAKVYLCIFICFSVKAIHLELASDLSTAAFLDVLQRFISRRGAPSQLYSDCGTNFVGAAAQLNREMQTFLKGSAAEITDFLALQEIQFIFNPPSAPHQGGLWERAIQSTKTLLIKMLQNQTPTLMQLSSLLIRIEGILNSRPLCPMSSDPTDVDVLTPGHFLIGRPILSPPQLHSSIPSTSLLSRFNWVQSHMQQFWNRWRLEYLPTLQERTKWTSNTPNLQVGDLVLLGDPNTPPLQWPRGRVHEILPGADGTVRRAVVKTPNGEYTRPAVRLYRLPVSD